MRVTSAWIVASSVLATAGIAEAETGARGFATHVISPSANLFDPDEAPAVRAGGGLVEEAELRAMAVDDSPHTLDAGHVQAEIDVAVLRTSYAHPLSDYDLSVMPTRFKVGVTDRIEAQLVIAPYERDAHGDATGTFQETTARLKVNLWGNDDGHTALALVPYATYSSDSGIDPGCAAIFGADMPADLALTLVPQVTIGDATTTANLTITVGHPIIGDLAGFVESVGGIDLEATTTLQANYGLTWGVTPNLEIDLGGRHGVVGDVADVELFARVAARR